MFFFSHDTTLLLVILSIVVNQIILCSSVGGVFTITNVALTLIAACSKNGDSLKRLELAEVDSHNRVIQKASVDFNVGYNGELISNGFGDKKVKGFYITLTEVPEAFRHVVVDDTVIYASGELVDGRERVVMPASHDRFQAKGQIDGLC